MIHRIAAQAAIIGLLCCFSILLAPSRASAEDQPTWRVVDIHGAATVMRPGVSPVSLTDNTDLHGGDQIRTELDGRVVLRRGVDTVLIAPNSLVAIPAADTGLFTRILQTFGTVLVNVAHRPDPHFEVHTPFLVAIVKGTTFTVSADSVSSAVQVVDGMVNVVDSAQRQSVTVTTGQTARINSQTGGQLKLDGPRQPALPGREAAQHADARGGAAPGGAGKDGGPHISRPIGLAPIDAVKASGGLLRNDTRVGPNHTSRTAGATGGEFRQASAAGDRANALGGPAGGAASPVAGLAGLVHGNGGANGNATNVAGLAALSHGGGNGNGNAGGIGNGNAGGNGNGKAGGKGNGHAGGNGNGNAGGNGNGNAGGNGNGHGHGHP